MTNLEELRKKAEAVSDDDWEEECFYFEDMTTPEIADLLSIVTPSAVLELIAEIERIKYDELTLRCLALTYLSMLGEDDPDEALETDLQAIDIKIVELTG